MVMHLIITVQIVFLLIFIEFVDEMKRAAIFWVISLIKEGAFGATKLQHTCDSLWWVLMISLLWVDHKDIKLLVDTKLLDQIYKLCLVTAHNLKIFHSWRWDAIKLFKQVFLFLSLKHISVLEFLLLNGLLHHGILFDGIVLPGLNLFKVLGISLVRLNLDIFLHLLNLRLAISFNLFIIYRLSKDY